MVKGLRQTVNERKGVSMGSKSTLPGNDGQRFSRAEVRLPYHFAAYNWKNPDDRPGSGKVSRDEGPLHEPLAVARIPLDGFKMRKS